jgi:hypothetical protein
MGTHKVKVSPPPFQVGQKLWSRLRRGPGATSQRCYPLTDGQIHSFNKSGIQPSRETQFLQGDLKSGACPKAHHMRDPHQHASLVAFLHLTIYQPSHYLPLAHFPPSASHLKPLSKMGCRCIEIHIEAITGEERETERRPRAPAGSG